MRHDLVEEREVGFDLLGVTRIDSLTAGTLGV
jgi:hypothetical protein